MPKAKQKEKPNEENVKEALNATVEIMSSAMDTGGKYVTNRKVGNGTLVWIPDDKLGTEPYNPNNESEREKAIEECMDSIWAREWQESVTGPDVSEEVAEMTRKQLCEGLYQD